MNKLFVRLAVSGAITVGMGLTALADGASINTTGPGSTNVVTSSSSNMFNQNTRNNADLGNWNFQTARSGNVWIFGNTRVNGSGLGSGNAFNSNSGQNTVNIDNNGGSFPFNLGGGSNTGSIFLTGPNSSNQIRSNNNNRFNSNTSNNVQAVNFNNQQANTGAVVISGNTVVSGVGGSGDAANFNTGTNNVNIENSTPTPSFGNNGDGNSADISVTGPGSLNRAQFNNSSSTNLGTNNNVSATNSSSQTATSGQVLITGNTVVEGVGGSGSAQNSNIGENDVGISNN